MTAFSCVAEVMEITGTRGIQASLKGLRHSFAIHCLKNGIPLNLVSKWIEHSSLEVTVIYPNTSGTGEIAITSRLWG